MLKKVLLASAMTLAFSVPAMAQDARIGDRPIKGPPPFEGVSRLYESISASATLPNEVSNDDALAMRIPKPAIFSGNGLMDQIRQDPCVDPEIAQLCLFAGEETVRKIRNYSWGRGALKYPSAAQLGLSSGQAVSAGGENLAVQMALLDYGIRKNLQKHYGERGATDQQEDQLDGINSANARIGDKAFRTFWGCKRDIKSINYGWPSLFSQHRLTTCHANVSARISLWLFSIEAGAGITNSRFARKVFFWIPNGASSITALTDVGLNIGFTPYNTTNANNWMATSGGARLAINKPPMVIKGQGAAVELGTNFNLTLP